MKRVQRMVLATIFLVPLLSTPSSAWQEGKAKSRLPPSAPAAASSASADKGTASTSVAPAGSPAVPKGSSASPRLAHYFPNVPLLTQDNKPVRFYEDLIKGKVVVISFMFTTCTSICPLTTTHLARVQELFGDRLGRDIFILSISVDPANDTPAALKKYAESYKAKPGWYFLTGEKENIRIVRAKLGVYDEDKMQHTGMLILGNETTGEWRKIPARRDPGEIANAVKTLIPTKSN